MVTSPHGGSRSDPQPAANAGVPRNDEAAAIDAKAKQFLRRAAVLTLGTAESQAAPAPAQPEPAASHAQVPQQGGRQSGLPPTSGESAHYVALDYADEHSPWWDEHLEAASGSAAAEIRLERTNSQCCSSCCTFPAIRRQQHR